MDGFEPRATPDLLNALANAPDRLTIGRLAQVHDNAAWTQALLHGGSRLPPERLHTLASELALRERPLTDAALAPLFQAAELPIRLLSIERELPMYVHPYGDTAGSYTCSGAAPAGVAPEWLTVSEQVLVESWRSSWEGKRPTRLTTVVDPWVAHSNGRIEVRVLALDAASGRHVPEATLRAHLPLGPRVTVTPLSPASAMSLLFSAAHGGAYGPNRSDAEARLLAWANLRALVGGDTPTDTAARAEACGFTRFESDGFFENVFWDLGLAVVLPDRLVLIAATDTD